MLEPNKEARPDIGEVLRTLKSLHASYEAEKGKLFVPNAAMLFDLENEKQKSLYDIYKAEPTFQIAEEVKQEESEEDPTKRMTGFYAAWRHEHESKEEPNHRLKIWVEQIDGKDIYHVSTLGLQKFELKGDVFDGGKDEDIAELQPNGDWLFHDMWIISKFAPLDYSFRLEGPRVTTFGGTDVKQLGTITSEGLEGHAVYLSTDGNCLYEGIFKNGKKHGPGRLIKRSANSGNITIREGSFVDNIA